MGEARGGGADGAVAAQLVVVRAGAGQVRLVVGILLPAAPVAVAHAALLAQSAGQIAAHRVGALVVGAVLEVGIVVAALRGGDVAARQVVPASLANIGDL